MARSKAEILSRVAQAGAGELDLLWCGVGHGVCFWLGFRKGSMTGRRSLAPKALVLLRIGLPGRALRSVRSWRENHFKCCLRRVQNGAK